MIPNRYIIMILTITLIFIYTLLILMNFVLTHYYLFYHNIDGYAVHIALDRRETYYYVHGKDELAFVVECDENIL